MFSNIPATDQKVRNGISNIHGGGKVERSKVAEMRGAGFRIKIFELFMLTWYITVVVVHSMSVFPRIISVLQLLGYNSPGNSSGKASQEHNVAFWSHRIEGLISVGKSDHLVLNWTYNSYSEQRMSVMNKHLYNDGNYVKM